MIESITKLAFMYVFTMIFIELVFPAGKRFLKYIYWTALLLTIFVTVGPYIIRIADDIHNVAVTYSRGKEAVDGIMGGSTNLNVGYQSIFEKFLGNAKFDWPTKGNITQEFNGEDHHGVDLSGKVGDKIKVSRPGNVTMVGVDDIYGNYLIISHGNGYETLYAHCSKIVVVKGQTILSGEKIAEVGNSGRSSGPHLHLELRLNGKAINPKEYFK